MNKGEAEEFADWFCRRHDEIYFDFMNRVLNEVRRQNNIAQIGGLAVEAELAVLHDPSIGTDTSSDK